MTIINGTRAMMRSFPWILGLLLVAACQPVPSGHGHSHGHSHSHSHGAASNTHSHGDGRPVKDTTLWVDGMEFLVEYPALVAGKQSRFSTHLTLLGDHSPLKEGELTVSLIKGQEGIRHRANAPTTPGVFSPALEPEAEGVYQLIFELNVQGKEKQFALGKVRVFPDIASAVLDSRKRQVDRSGEISFPKEQAWEIPFEAQKVEAGEVFQVLPTSGQWLTAPGDFRQVVAPVDGVVSFGNKNSDIGSSVQRGQPLLALRREVSGEDSHGQALSLAAPMSGFIKQMLVDKGDYVKKGQVLMHIGTNRTRTLQVDVGPAYSGLLNQIEDINYQIGEGQWGSMKASGGRVQSIGKEVSSASPMLPIVVQLSQETGSPKGSFTEVRLKLGQAREGLLVPYSALLENYGQYAVIVQLGGERFELRQVETGQHSGDQVEVLRGLQAGEYVVTKGAYQVKMASMSGQAIGHGHVH